MNEKSPYEELCNKEDDPDTKRSDDDILKSVETLKKTADAVNLEQSGYDFDTRDVVHDCIFMAVCILVAFGWTMLMLLIISFITLSYIHFDIKVMLYISGGMAFITTVYYAVGMRRKYKGKRIRKRTKFDQKS